MSQVNASPKIKRPKTLIAGFVNDPPYAERCAAMDAVCENPGFELKYFSDVMQLANPHITLEFRQVNTYSDLLFGVYNGTLDLTAQELDLKEAMELDLLPYAMQMDNPMYTLLTRQQGDKPVIELLILSGFKWQVWLLFGVAVLIVYTILTILKYSIFKFPASRRVLKLFWALFLTVFLGAYGDMLAINLATPNYSVRLPFENFEHLTQMLQQNRCTFYVINTLSQNDHGRSRVNGVPLYSMYDISDISATLAFGNDITNAKFHAALKANPPQTLPNRTMLARILTTQTEEQCAVGLDYDVMFPYYEQFSCGKIAMVTLKGLLPQYYAYFASSRLNSKKALQRLATVLADAGTAARFNNIIEKHFSKQRFCVQDARENRKTDPVERIQLFQLIDAFCLILFGLVVAATVLVCELRSTHWQTSIASPYEVKIQRNSSRIDRLREAVDAMNYAKRSLSFTNDRTRDESIHRRKQQIEAVTLVIGKKINAHCENCPPHIHPADVVEWAVNRVCLEMISS